MAGEGACRQHRCTHPNSVGLFLIYTKDPLHHSSSVKRPQNGCKFEAPLHCQSFSVKENQALGVRWGEGVGCIHCSHLYSAVAAATQIGSPQISELEPRIPCLGPASISVAGFLFHPNWPRKFEMQEEIND